MTPTTRAVLLLGLVAAAVALSLGIAFILPLAVLRFVFVVTAAAGVAYAAYPLLWDDDDGDYDE